MTTHQSKGFSFMQSRLGHPAHIWLRQSCRGRLLEAATRQAAALDSEADLLRRRCEALARERDAGLTRIAQLEEEVGAGRLQERRLLNEVQT